MRGPIEPDVMAITICHPRPDLASSKVGNGCGVRFVTKLTLSYGLSSASSEEMGNELPTDIRLTRW